MVKQLQSTLILFSTIHSMSILKNIAYVFAVVTLVISSYGCRTSYQRILTSGTAQQQANLAMKWFDKENYFKSIPLFDAAFQNSHLLKDRDRLYYNYGLAHFYEKDYLLAAHYFNRAQIEYANSTYASKSAYQYAMCYYKLSPQAALDQEDTKVALDAFQQFVNQYPDDSLKVEANQRISELYNKLQLKALQGADLYFKTEKYRAAAVTYENILFEYPALLKSEYVNFQIVRSKYEYAKSSKYALQKERFEDCIKSFQRFIKKYPNGDYQLAALKLYNLSNLGRIASIKNLAIQSFNWDKRTANLIKAIDLYNQEEPILYGDKAKQDLAKLYEQLHYELIYSNYQKELEANTDTFDVTLQAYNKYVNLFGREGRYDRKARRIHKKISK